MNEKGFAICGTATVKLTLPSVPGEDVLIGRMTVAFREPVAADVETVYGFDVLGKPARQMGLLERKGTFRVYPTVGETIAARAACRRNCSTPS